MLKPESILVYLNIDRDDAVAFDCGLSVARAFDAKLKVVDVVPEPTRLSKLVEGIDEEVLARLRSNRLTALRNRVGEFVGDEFEVETEVFSGISSVEVIREVLRNRHDLVIKTAEGGRGLRPRLFGSTARRLLRKCPCPVWILKPSSEPKPGRMLACINPDPSSEESLSLNRRILEMAESIRMWSGAEMDLLHAWDTAVYRRLRRELSAGQYSELMRSFRKESEERVRSFVKTALSDEWATRTRLIEGEPAGVISRFVEDYAIDVVVMGSLGRTGIEGLVLGNVADEVFGEASCSVFALKPEGFVSPIVLE